MIHLKSTLAVSAIMLSGLVAASPFPYRSDEQPRKPRPAAALQATTVAEAPALAAAVTAWADPPVKAQEKAQEQAELPVPAVAAAMPASSAEPTAMAAPVATAPVRHASLQSPVQPKAEQARRRKAARAVRERQMAAQQAAPSAPEAKVAAREAPSTTQRIDPIGDILRGLGIGRES